MTTYPHEITQAVLDKHIHLSNAEVRRDLHETEAEILAFEQLALGLRAVERLSTTPDHERRMNDFRASGYEERNRDRRAFVVFLRRLLEARGQAVTA